MPLDNYQEILSDPPAKGRMISNLSVDCCIFGFENNDLKVLLVQHASGRSQGQWALPGEFVLKDRNLQEMPHHVLQRLTGLENIFVEQLGTFGRLDRVDYGRIITIAYYALISPQKYNLKVGADALDVAWVNVAEATKLIYDHNEILDYAMIKLRDRIKTYPIGFELLPDKFTLTHIQKLYEAMLGHSLDTRNFRRKMLSSKLLQATSEVDDSVPYRAPKLYTFDKERYDEMLVEGYFFQL